MFLKRAVTGLPGCNSRFIGSPVTIACLYSRYSSRSSDSKTTKLPSPQDLAGMQADPEPLRESAQEIWTREQTGIDIPYKPEAHPYHELYTPHAKPRTGLGPLVKPLHWPEFDQSSKPKQVTGLDNSWYRAEFEDTATAPIGDYPRNIPFQWAQLRDPFKYWDQQGRRNYGEVLHDQDNMGDWLGIGPEVHWGKPLMALVKVIGIAAAMGVAVAWWDPESQRIWTEKEFPFDGLRVELGGDPMNPQDNWMKANGNNID